MSGIPGSQRAGGNRPAVFFDAFTQIGPRDAKHPAHGWRLEDVIAEMDHCSISAALVQSTNAVTYDPMYGNREVCALIGGRDNLFPVWNLMPHQTGEFPAPRELDRLLREHGVRAVTIHPLANAWDWEADHAAELLSWLQDRRLLCIVRNGQVGGWTALDRFLGRWPGIQVLLLGASWGEQRYLMPLLLRRRNLHTAFDAFQVHYGIERLCAEGCEDQLLYASNAPLMAMGAHRAYVDYADISPSARAKIAGGNLSRLLGGVAPPREIENRGEDDLMAAARRGLPLPVPVIDMHMHILHEGENGGGASYRMERGGPGGVFPLLRRLGVAGGGVTSWIGTVGMDTLAGNRCVAAALDAAPPGFWGMANSPPG